MDDDTLAMLEERIVRAVETVTRLKKEKEDAQSSASEAVKLKARVAELTKELEAAHAERDALKADKETVRKRVEKLLETIDSLAAS